MHASLPSRWHPARASGRDGFTLVELLVAISLVGVIATVVAAMVAVTIRANPLTEERTDVARSLQGLVTWLAQDVDSTPPNGFTTDRAAPSGCQTSPGTNLLLLQWTERVGGVTVAYVANYRHVTDRAGVSTIRRITCRGSGAKPLPNTFETVASAPLPSLPSTWEPGMLPFRVSIVRDTVGDVDLVVFEVRTLDGVLLRVDSAPKNPGHTLPPATVGSTVPPVTTVLDTTTTLGAGTTTTAVATTSTTVAPCRVTSSTYPTAIGNTDPNGNGRSSTNVGVLQQALSISVRTSGPCPGLEARPELSCRTNSDLFRNFATVDGVSHTAVFPGYPQGSSELWRDGTCRINLFTALDVVTPVSTLTVTIR